MQQEISDKSIGGEEVFEKILDVLLDSLLDTLKVLPILFLVYVLIEIIENKCANNWKNYHFLNNKFSPIIASSVGIIPQCGFSVVATDLYADKKITMGTLLAIYIATSDEALPILLSGSYDVSMLKYVGILVAIKFVYAIAIGYSVNMVVAGIEARKAKVVGMSKDVGATVKIYSDAKHDHKHHGHDNEDDYHEEHEESVSRDHDYGCCGHDVTEDIPTFKRFIIHPLIHSLKICLFILIVNIIFGAIIEFVGIDALSKFMLNNSIFQPFIVGLVGLIPNCASSVVITELFVLGGISFASCVAGLCVNAGVAILVLFKANKNIKENIAIVTSLYLAGTILGFVIELIF